MTSAPTRPPASPRPPRTQREPTTGFVAGDVRIVFGKLYYVAGQLGGSWTRDFADVDPRSSPLLEARVRPHGKVVGIQLQGHGHRKGLRVSGRVRPPKRHRPGARVQPVLHLRRSRSISGEGKLLRRAVLHLALRRTSQVGNALEGVWQAEADFTLRGGWQFNLHGELGFTNFEPGAYNGYQVDQGGTTVPYDAPSGTDNNFNVNVRSDDTDLADARCVRPGDPGPRGHFRGRRGGI